MTSRRISDVGTSLNSGNEWGSNDDEQTCVACLFSDVHKPGLLAELPITTILGTASVPG